MSARTVIGAPATGADHAALRIRIHVRIGVLDTQMPHSAPNRTASTTLV